MEIELEALLRVRDGRLHDLNGLTAQLWDEDLAADDLLSEGVVSGEVTLFRALFRFDPKMMASADSLGEKYPDLYVVVKNEQGIQLFRSAVLRNTVLEVSAEPGNPARLEFVEA
jgi:hypothetical protein